MPEPEQTEIRYFDKKGNDPMRIRWRTRQVDLVRAYDQMGKEVHQERKVGEPVDDACSCQDYITHMRQIIEDLHAQIDELDPTTVMRPDGPI